LHKADLYWNLYTELRKEIIESQRIRAQVIGFKITFVSASMGLLASRFEQIPNTLLIIPAIASIFFDFLINSYSFSIKRIGFYLWETLEPQLKEEAQIPNYLPLWQSYLKDRKTGQILSLIGNFGITIIASIAAIIALLFPVHKLLSPSLIGLIIILLGLDLWSFLKPRKIDFREASGDDENIRENQD